MKTNKILKIFITLITKMTVKVVHSMGSTNRLTTIITSLLQSQTRDNSGTSIAKTFKTKIISKQGLTSQCLLWQAVVCSIMTCMEAI